MWFVLLLGGLALFGYWEISKLQEGLDILRSGEETGIDSILALFVRFGQLSWQVLAAAIVGTAVFLGFSLSAALRGARKEVPPEREQPVTGGPGAGKDEAESLESRRRELHLLSLLQRDGRLIDFLQEDLQAYDDTQIGSAVRSIQESCKAALNRYINPRAIIDQEEGQEVTIPEGFDPGSIKLTGNVTGSPPFKGTLQHRGWRAGERALPTVSGAVDPDVIAPAEVEIA